MKYFWIPLLVFALLWPSVSWAESLADVHSSSSVQDTTDSWDMVRPPEKKHFRDYLPYPCGIEIGGGSMFVVGLEWWFDPYGLIYAQERPADIHDLWVPHYAWMWSIRTRYVYNSEHGFLLYPNIQGLFPLAGFALGPQVGWFSTNGFDYGASLRLDLMILMNVEIGYFARKERLFLNVIFTISLPRIGMLDP